ncbi:MAG: methyl-accepting chemotaxis protein [Kangiellaceae bacterium]|nr:methyl-accepting chemotaxis protein [Kangiellaceae bacterium]
MFKALFICYSSELSSSIREKFDHDFKLADKIIMFAIIAFSLVVAFVTSWQHGYFKLGMIGGAAISTITIFAYLTMAGTMMCRVIIATALTALMAITVQQSNGLGEGHFLFFLGFTILIRYKDFVPLLLFVVLTVVHHLSLTYCQTVGVELWGQPLTVFSWGADSDWGLIAPLLYHVVFAVLSLIISTYYIYDGNVKFVDANGVIGAVEKAASGDLRARIETDVETTLVNQTNHFLDSIHKTFSQIDLLSNSLATQASETKSSAFERAEKASNQQNELSQVATAVTEMAAATQEIAGNAERTASASNESVIISSKGGELAETCQQSITKLAENVSKAADIISDIDKNSQQISSIVATISSIAEQTNLLALNAAIEAARAGEEGRGFAVVADEVRVLSQRTHTSTEEITAMINTFKNTTHSAVQTMSGCHELANTSVSDAIKATDSFMEIGTAIRNISDMATQIATAAEQQTAVTEEIARNTESINHASLGFFDDAQHDSKEAEKLETQAVTMGELVGEFKLE